MYLRLYFSSSHKCWGYYHWIINIVIIIIIITIIIIII
jgi:hypothetical protein